VSKIARALAVVAGASIAAGHVAGAGAVPQGFVGGSTLPPCIGVVDGNTFATCAADAVTNLQLVPSAPVAGVVSASVSGPQCDANTTTNVFVSFTYQDALGTLRFTGGMPYGPFLNPLTSTLDCRTRYGLASANFPITVAGSGAYLTVDILCQFLLEGPSTPPTSEGLASVSFTARTGTTCP
jgi:hypothetical protein